MNLLLDENLSWRLVKKLEDDFGILIHSNKINPKNKRPKDIEIWEYALNNNFTIVTNDEDFSRLSLFKGFPPKVILLKIGNAPTNIIASILIKNKKRIKNFISNKEIGILEIL
ncbi:MAG TPA: DUF5615 family PIN-like protein [Chitinophagales bacterium]|nr:DUF5615 family PIN-like protein [Chitinophagales bacterium]HNM32624.1 DUF5615 family PIN-like protein [Chitinophagales bacterium]